MTLGERVFSYCERGTNAAIGAEPFNAISNAGFFLAALIFWQLVLWRPPEQRSPDHFLFVALVFAIFFGSTAFHVYADRGTELADVIPIGLFMVVYLGFALNRFLSVPPGCTVFLVVLFAVLVGASMQVQCWEGGIGFAGGAADAKPCMNGSMGYLPALGALIIVSMLLAERRHKAAPYLLAATAIFTISVLLRSLDMSLCDHIVIEGREVGTHFIWHLLNAVVLFLLMRASLETETRPLPSSDVPQGDVEEKPEETAPEPAAKKPADEAEDAPKDKPKPKRKRPSKPKPVPKDELKEESKGEPEAETGRAPQTEPDASEAAQDAAAGEPKDEAEPEKTAAADDKADDKADAEEGSETGSDAKASDEESGTKKEPS